MNSVRPNLQAWLRGFRPARMRVGQRERWLGCLGAMLGLLVTEWLSRLAFGSAQPWFIAPMGASAVLLFAVPASPLAQPWSIVGGNLVSALVGVACAHGFGHSGAAAGLAGALAIAAMMALRCLHPPGGAVALTAVIGGPAVEALGYGFAFWPVLVNSLFMLMLALAFNNLAGRRYPHQAPEAARPHLTSDRLPSGRLGITPEDLDAALAAHGELLDISKDDLEEILQRAQWRADSRRLGDVRCQDIMSRDVVRVGDRDTLEVAWNLLERHRVKALPVVDAQGVLQGIVSLHDFFLGHAVPSARRAPPAASAGGAAPVAEIMTRSVRVACPEQPIVELVSLFSDGGLHHLPVVDAQRHVVGMITQSDLVAALFKAGGGTLPPPSGAV